MQFILNHPHYQLSAMCEDDNIGPTDDPEEIQRFVNQSDELTYVFAVDTRDNHSLGWVATMQVEPGYTISEDETIVDAADNDLFHRWEAHWDEPDTRTAR